MRHFISGALMGTVLLPWMAFSLVLQDLRSTAPGTAATAGAILYLLFKI